MDKDEGYNDKIYDNYKDEYKNFRTSFGILIGFAVVFLFFFFLPYYYNLSVIEDNSIEQKRIGQDLKIINDSTIKVKDLNSNFTNGVNILRQFLTQIPANSSRESDDPESCSSIAEYTKYVNCRVTNYMTSLFNFNSISKPLNNLSNSSKELVNASELINKMTDSTEKFKNHLLTHPNFYTTVEGKRTTINQLKDMVNTTFVNKELNQSSNRSNGLFSDVFNRAGIMLELKLNSTKDIINLTKGNNELLENTLSRFDSPFGPILYNINESVLIFPLLLSLGSLISSSFAASAIKMRNNVYMYYNAKYWKNDIEKSKDIFIIAPLWIDPFQSYANQIIKYLILFIPLVIFIISLVFITIEWSILNHLKDTNVDWVFPGSQYNAQNIFLLLYTLGLVLFIYGYVRIMLELKSHRKIDVEEPGI